MNEKQLSELRREMEDAALRYARAVERLGKGGDQKWCVVTREDALTIEAVRAQMHSIRLRAGWSGVPDPDTVRMRHELIQRASEVVPRGVDERPIVWSDEECDEIDRLSNAYTLPQFLQGEPEDEDEDDSPCDRGNHIFEAVPETYEAGNYDLIRCTECGVARDREGPLAFAGEVVPIPDVVQEEEPEPYNLMGLSVYRVVVNAAIHKGARLNMDVSDEGKRLKVVTIQVECDCNHGGMEMHLHVDGRTEFFCGKCNGEHTVAREVRGG